MDHAECFSIVSSPIEVVALLMTLTELPKQIFMCHKFSGSNLLVKFKDFNDGKSRNTSFMHKDTKVLITDKKLLMSAKI